MITKEAALRRLGATAKDLDDPFLRLFQRKYDEVLFDQHPYAVEYKGIPHNHAKVGHIALHVVNIEQKLRRLLRDSPQLGTQKAVQKEAFPDSLMYRTQIANSERYNLSRRLGSLRTSSTSLEEAHELLSEAVAPLVIFAERQEHGKVDMEQRQRILKISVPALHEAGLIMANSFGVLPQVGHAERLIQHARQQPTQPEADNGKLRN